MNQPLMPKATAVWLIDNTMLTFEQIGLFCGLHSLEIQGIADGEVANGIVGRDPISNGELTKEEIIRCENNKSEKLGMIKNEVVSLRKSTGPKYTPLSKRQNRPEGVLWLTKNFPQLSDGQIVKLVGSTKNTVSAIRNKNYWNSSNLSAKDPVVSNLCTQIDIKNAAEKAERKIARKEKEKEREKRKESQKVNAE